MDKNEFSAEHLFKRTAIFVLLSIIALVFTFLIHPIFGIVAVIPAFIAGTNWGFFALVVTEQEMDKNEPE